MISCDIFMHIYNILWSYTHSITYSFLQLGFFSQINYLCDSLVKMFFIYKHK